MSGCGHEHPDRDCVDCVSDVRETVVRVARACARNSADADDITGEVLVGLLESEFRGFDPFRGPLGPWLSQVTRNRATSYYRSRRRTEQRDHHDFLVGQRFGDLATGDYAAVEVLAVADRFLTQLNISAEHRAAVLLKLADYTFSEIAQLMADVFDVRLTGTRWGQIIRPLIAALGQQLRDDDERYG